MKNKISFEAWLEQIDRILPCHHDDLPDVCYRDWYDDGVSPSQAAKRALKNASE
jgi:hypothetical protein